MGVAPLAEFFHILQVVRQLRVLGETPPPGGPAFELGVGVDVQDIEELGKGGHAFHGLFVIAALAGGEIAGGDPELWVARADACGHGLEDAGVVGIAPFSRFVADLHGLHQLAFSRWPELAGKCLAVSAGIRIEILPGLALDRLEHEAGVDGPFLLTPRSIDVAPVHPVFGKGKRRQNGSFLREIPLDRMIVAHHAGDRSVELGLELDGVAIDPDEIAHQRAGFIGRGPAGENSRQERDGK